MLLMVVSFLIFWYPLFLLTVLDVHYKQSPQAYRACMVLAWSQPVTTPLFCGIIYFDIISMENLRKADYTKAIPMKDSTSFSSASCAHEEVRHKMHSKYRMYDMGFTNENFSFSNQASPSLVRDMDTQPPSQDLQQRQGHVWCEDGAGESSQHTLIM
nr:hypothetical protein BaRGS_025534 [Batillaria attramentaria]